MKYKNNIFQKLMWNNIHLLILELLFGYAVTKALVLGNTKLSEIIDQMLYGTGGQTIDSKFIVYILLLVLIGFIGSFLRQKTAAQLSINIQQKFRGQAERKLMKMEYQNFDNTSSSSLINNMVKDINMVSGYYSEIFPGILSTFITTAVVLYSMVKIDLMLVMVFAVVFPIILMTSRYANNKIGALAKKRWELVDELADIAYDNVQGIVVGRSYNLQEEMSKKIYRANEKLLKFEFRRNRISIISWTLGNLVKWLPQMVVVVIMLFRVVSGSLTIGNMTFFILMLDRIMNPLSELPGLLNSAKECFVSRDRLQKLMDQEEEQEGQVSEKLDTEMALSFSNVRFSYGAEREILSGISFSVKKGERIAFVGESGEGKSTIFKLICRFYEKQGGEVKLYGTKLDEWNIDAARGQLALVSQNVFLFPETIAWNVACGSPKYSMEQIKEACKMANIHDFIEALPQGYETMVGERGDLFSGGEKQRISLARAILKDASILLLDEATSAVDTKNETLIKAALERISEGKTTISIAHRLSTIEDVDCIYVISKGKIAEAGTKKQLLDNEGIFYKLYEAQRKGDEANVEK